MHRFIALLAVAVLGAAAPTRAWCEAACLAPTETTQHCPTHEPSGDAATISASSTDDCPILESARPTLQARLDLQAVMIGTYAPVLDTDAHVTPSSVRPHSASTVFERCTPLRI
jgi:hypothetical protein